MQPYKAVAEDSAPAPSGGGGRSQFADPKARARHAALVRWKKENPIAANVQERLAQIRAARAKKKAGKGGGKGKGKAGGKGKAAAKPKQTPEQRKQAKQQEQAAAREVTLKGAGVGEDARASLDDLAAGRDVDDDGGLEKMGLAERGKDGKLRLTSAGKAAHRAAGRGDAAGVKDAISRAKDKTVKDAERAQQKGERQAKQKQRKQKREKSKGKARGGGEDGSETPQEKANKNRAAVAKQTGLGDLEGTMVRIGAGMKNDDLEKDNYDKLIAKGLVKRGSDGVGRLTPQGRAWRRAADKGDVEGAQNAISEAADRVAQETDKAKAKAKPKQSKLTPPPQTTKGMTMADITDYVDDLELLRDRLARDSDDAIKAGRRNSGSDQAQIDAGYELAMQLCDLFEALGADTGEEDEEAEGDEEAAVAEEEDEEATKAIADDPVAYAYQECSGIQQASAALAQIAQIAAMEAGEQDTDTPSILAKLRQAMQLLTDYINGEVDEIKAIGKREDVNPKAGVSAYGDVKFADEKNKKYPIDTEAHVRSAWNYISKPENAGKYAPDEVATIKKNIVAAWKKLIDKAGPPSAETKKSVDDTFIVGDAVKALANGRIGGMAVRFGSETEPDMSPTRDYFTKSTQYWLDAWERRPMLYHHALEESTADDPVIGTWTKAAVTDEGVWLEGELNRSYRYHAAIKELVRRGVLCISTDSAPHLVRREAKNGANEIKRWPIVAASLTATPAEPRLAGVSFKALIAELGIDDISNQEADDTDERESADGQKAAEDRARVLLMELDLLALENAQT